jgi:sigma-54 dependent transcriptional regulator, acetoin dehydrogenase operon transcriptional activator AcoR
VRASPEKRRPTREVERYRGVAKARERFLAGDDRIRGVRPEVAISWYRCREQYRVDPGLSEAPVASARGEHPLEHDVVIAELGGIAASVSREVDSLNGIVTVTDSAGRILAAWGDKGTLSHASESNLAPWSCWSEWATGTNGMGTALEARGPVLVRGPEHWCQGFHDWVCAGVAVRDVVTDDPVAVLNISRWRASLPEATAEWLAGAVMTAQAPLRQRAHDTGAELAAAFTEARAHSGRALAALDASGKVVIADDDASLFLGVPAHTPAVDPALRWDSGLDLRPLARYAGEHAQQDPQWVGSTHIFTHLSGSPTPLTVRGVFLSGRVIGTLVSFGASDGEEIHAPAAGVAGPPPRRILGVHGDRSILLRLTEISVATADGNDVWLTTDDRRLQAAIRGLDKLEAELGGGGFLRVHRRFLVNLSRVREVERGSKGELLLVMDTGGEPVPVSRRNAPAVRRALGL